MSRSTFLANIGSPAIGQILSQPSATTYVGEGVEAGPLRKAEMTRLIFRVPPLFRERAG